jgi:hypothetical protein
VGHRAGKRDHAAVAKGECGEKPDGEDVISLGVLERARQLADAALAAEQGLDDLRPCRVSERLGERRQAGDVLRRCRPLRHGHVTS